jgi:hypothetical protein
VLRTSRAMRCKLLKVTGKLESSASVSHGSMLDDQQHEVPTLSADKSRISSINLILLSGTDIRLSMELAKLDAVKRVKQLEKWIGPL